MNAMQCSLNFERAATLLTDAIRDVEASKPGLDPTEAEWDWWDEARLDSFASMTNW